MINKNKEIFPGELILFPIKSKNTELSFSGGRVSSDGGLLLILEIYKQLNLLSSASKSNLEGRDQRYIDYSIKELLIQRVFQIIAGYEDCNDLREDMILKMCAGRLPQSGNNLVSQPTMTRLENSVTRSDLFRLGKCPIGNN